MTPEDRAAEYLGRWVPHFVKDRMPETIADFAQVINAAAAEEREAAAKVAESFEPTDADYDAYDEPLGTGVDVAKLGIAAAIRAGSNP